MNPRIFLRMSKLARHPPSWGRVKLVLGIVAVCAALAAIEHWVGWPDALTLDGKPGRIGKP